MVIQDGPFDAEVPKTMSPVGAWLELEADPLRRKLGAGWSWLRPVPEATRMTGQGLQLRVLPGNIAFDRTDGKNILLRALPATGPLAISVGVQLTPEEQYEQAGLALFADESSYVKLVHEKFDGRVVVNLVREEGEKISIIASSAPVTSPVELRLTLIDQTVTGYLRQTAKGPWTFVGSCLVSAPRPSRAALFAFMGGEKERWAGFHDFRVETPTGKSGPGVPRTTAGD